MAGVGVAMKCAYCGTELPEGALFCGSCGRETTPLGGANDILANPKCPSCGRSIRPEFRACPYCGHSFLTSRFESVPPVHIGTGKRVALYVLSLLIPLVGIIAGVIYLTKKDETSKHVGTLCIVLGVVSIVVVAPVASSIILYLMVIDFGTDYDGLTPQATFSRSTITNGQKVTVLAITRADVPWDDITVVVKDATTGVASWTPTKEGLNDNAGDSMNYSAKALGSLTVCCWAFDIIGNGLVNGGDYITLSTYGGATTFVSGQSYTVQFLYEPTGDQIGTPVTWTA